MAINSNDFKNNELAQVEYRDANGRENLQQYLLDLYCNLGDNIECEINVHKFKKIFITFYRDIEKLSKNDISIEKIFNENNEKYDYIENIHKCVFKQLSKKLVNHINEIAVMATKETHYKMMIEAISFIERDFSSLSSQIKFLQCDFMRKFLIPLTFSKNSQKKNINKFNEIYKKIIKLNIATDTTFIFFNKVDLHSISSINLDNCNELFNSLRERYKNDTKNIENIFNTYERIVKVSNLYKDDIFKYLVFLNIYKGDISHILYVSNILMFYDKNLFKNVLSDNFVNKLESIFNCFYKSYINLHSYDLIF